MAEIITDDDVFSMFYPVSRLGKPPLPPGYFHIPLNDKTETVAYCAQAKAAPSQSSSGSSFFGWFSGNQSADPAAAQKSSSTKWVLHFHGNGERIENYIGQTLQERMTRAGFNVCFAEYRGYSKLCDSFGQQPSPFEIAQDSQCYLQFLKRMGATEIHVYGRSIGTISACSLANSALEDSFVRTITIESGLSSRAWVQQRLEKRFPSRAADFAERWLKDLPITQWLGNFARNGRTVLLIHASDDPVVPVDNFLENYEACGGPAALLNVHTLRLDHGRHSLWVWQPDELFRGLMSVVNMK